MFVAQVAVGLHAQCAAGLMSKSHRDFWILLAGFFDTDSSDSPCSLVPSESPNRVWRGLVEPLLELKAMRGPKQTRDSDGGVLLYVAWPLRITAMVSVLDLH
jgi:hypothetical protein